MSGVIGKEGSRLNQIRGVWWIVIWLKVSTFLGDSLTGWEISGLAMTAVSVLVSEASESKMGVKSMRGLDMTVSFGGTSSAFGGNDNGTSGGESASLSSSSLSPKRPGSALGSSTMHSELLSLCTLTLSSFSTASLLTSTKPSASMLSDLSILHALLIGPGVFTHSLSDQSPLSILARLTE